MSVMTTDVLTTDAPPAVRPYRWTREAYERMGEAGVFDPEARVQLIDGEVIEMSPQKSRHASTVSCVQYALFRAWPASAAHLRIQLPLDVSDDSQPEPDVAVVAGTPKDYADAHPTQALLVVEVSDTTLALDRTRKLAAYARAGVPEYWIVNLVAGELEVYRDAHGDTFRTKQTFAPEEAVTPLHASEASIPIDALIP